jgi:hypothetical protein
MERLFGPALVDGLFKENSWLIAFVSEPASDLCQKRWNVMSELPGVIRGPDPECDHGRPRLDLTLRAAPGLDSQAHFSKIDAASTRE